MSFSYLNRGNAILAELDEDFLTQEVGEEERTKLMLVDQTTQLGELLPSSSLPAYDEESESAAFSEEKEKELYSDTHGGSLSSLVTYLKTISGFHLLTEEEEITLAKLIKEREQDCKREPILEEIAQKTNIPLASIEKVLQSFKDSVSSDTFIEEKGEGEINPSLNHENTSIPEGVVFSNLCQTIEVSLSFLTPQEREI